MCTHRGGLNAAQNSGPTTVTASAGATTARTSSAGFTTTTPSGAQFGIQATLPSTGRTYYIRQIHEVPQQDGSYHYYADAYYVYNGAQRDVRNVQMQMQIAAAARRR